jgi:hypothetical protein
MYRLLFLIFLGCINTIYAQEVRKTLVSQKILPFTFEHVLRYDVATGDSSDYIHCSFQDMKYTTIVVTGSIFCSTQKSLDDTKAELSSVVKFMTENPGVVFSKGSYNVHDFAPKMIWYQDGTKTTRFNIATANKLLIALGGVKLRE